MNLPYSNSTTDRLLGCLIQAPTLCLEDKYKLDKSEFKINKFHQILFISIYNLNFIYFTPFDCILKPL